MTEEVTVAIALYGDEMRRLAELGLTDHEIATRLQVDLAEVRSHPGVIAALDTAAGKLAADTRVRRALYQRAVGYTRTVEKIGRENEIVTLVEEVMPDISAQTKWLEQRDPANWGKSAKVTHDVGPSLRDLILASMKQPELPVPDARVVAEQ